MTRRTIEVEISLDTSEFDRNFARLSEGPDGFTYAKFSTLSAEQWSISKAAIHIETGSLYSSAKNPIDTSEHEWRGEVRYGGGGVPDNAFPGPARDPGKYAAIEYNRGGDHDWIEASGLREIEPEYLEAILDWLRKRPS